MESSQSFSALIASEPKSKRKETQCELSGERELQRANKKMRQLLEDIKKRRKEKKGNMLEQNKK